MDTEHPQSIGPYEILGVIGKGAMGKVYKAVQPSSNQIVAIKVLPAEFMEDEERVERFDREAQAVALLKHKNVVQIIEKAEEDDLAYFVMEYVPGTSLDAVLRQRRLSLPETIRVFKGVCNGLDAAHKKTIVHRDLSPRNILVSEDLATVKIADFGISRVETISRDQGTLSTTEFSLGSLHYMAPEQARDMASADHRADIYSLGVLLYEMLTGRVPVGRFNLPSQLNSEAPPEIDPIVLRCLEADPQNRYPTVGRLLKEVRRLEDQLRLGLVHEVRGIGTQTSKVFRKSARARTTRMALLSVGGVAILGAAFLLISRSLKEQPEPSPALAGPAELTQTDEPVLEPDVDPLADSLNELAVPELEQPADSGPGSLEDRGSPGSTGSTGSAGSTADTESSPRTATPEANQLEPARSSASPLAEDIEVARNKMNADLLDEARADVEGLIAENPRTELTPLAYLLLGEIHEKRKDSDKARAAYVELQSRFEGSDEAAESIFRSATLLRREGGRDRLRDAAALLGEFAQQSSGSRWGAQALIEKAAIEGDTRWNLQDPVLAIQVPAALVTYRDLVTDYPQHPGTEDALWNLGEMYADLKKFELSAEAYESLGTRFPSTKHDVWWAAGQVYDRRLDDNDRAVAAYRKVPTDSRHLNNAQRRIAKLTK